MSVMLTCGDAYGLIVRTIDIDDARLSVGERAALRRHLASCARCRDEYETQHDVRRLLVLHIQDGLPTGFDERLNARLDNVSHRDTRDTRRRAWGARLIPLAAALLLTVAGPSVRDAGQPEAAPGAGPASSSGTAVREPRAFTTIVLPIELQTEPQRRDRPLRRHGTPPVSAEDVARAPAPALARPPAGDSDADETEFAIAAGVSGTLIESASKAAKEVPGTPGVRGDSAPSFDPRVQQRERIASRKDDANRKEDADRKDRASREHAAASERPAILPRPPAPFPNARPAMPAPPAVLPDRSIPPW